MSVLRSILALFLLSIAAAAPVRGEVPVVLILGDSLSAAHAIPVESGWVALLQQRLSQHGRARVVNASISGETTAGGLSRLPALLGEHAPDVVAIELGANDGLRGLPIAQIRDNLEQLVDIAQAASARVLLLGIELPVNFGPRYRDQLRAVYAELAQAKGTDLVPFLLDGVALEPELILDDGLHPNAAAQPRILDNVWPVLAPMLGAGAAAPAGR
jgi:acyl-CoA thioesterase-1